jgi:hypothetical protein
MLHKLRIALAVTFVALVAVTAVDSASAQSFVGQANQDFFLDLGLAGGWDGGFGP